MAADYPIVLLTFALKPGRTENQCYIVIYSLLFKERIPAFVNGLCMFFYVYTFAKIWRIISKANFFAHLLQVI